MLPATVTFLTVSAPAAAAAAANATANFVSSLI